MVRKYKNNQEKLDAMRQAIALRQKWLQAIREGATKEEMEKMIALNPGFDSRINRKIDFPDYSIDEQFQIFNILIPI